MIPKTKSQEEVFSKILDERTSGLDKKLDEIATKIAAKPKEEKIEDIIRKMKEKTPERILKKQEEVKESVKEPVKEPIKEPEKLKEPVKEPVKESEPEHIHDDVFCPTCQKGHVHKIESSGLKLKCTDGKCGEEYFVIPKSADHACTNCGFPIKKPEDEKSLDGCPFCSNNEAHPFKNGNPPLKFDFSKMKK